jgi:hypothetical protein
MQLLDKKHGQHGDMPFGSLQALLTTFPQEKKLFPTFNFAHIPTLTPKFLSPSYFCISVQGILLLLYIIHVYHMKPTRAC